MNDLSERLEQLLKTERAVLMSGDLGSIDRILQEKRAFVDALASGAHAPEAFAALRLRLQSNNALYDSALAGIRRVVDRLGTLQQIRKSLDTYDSRGRRQTITHSADHRLEKRA